MVDPSLVGEDGKFNFVPQEVAAKVQSEHRFVTHRQSHVIWVYGNGSYTPDGEELIRAEVRELLGDEAKENRVNEVVAHIRETTYTEPEKFEAPVNLVNLKNGTLNITTNEFTPHTPDTIFTHELPVEYKPTASCPNIMKFLSEILNAENIPVVQEIVGYCLLRDYRFGKAVMLLGEGENGKSTLLNLIEALLGENNVATPSLQDIVYNRFAASKLYGKLANIHADIPTKELKQTGRFKMLTGGDLIYGDQKFKEPFTFRNHAKLIYSANELPRTLDMSRAFWRRWIVIKFSRVFPEDDPNTDKNLLKKLTTPEELSGFLNWALEGLKRLMAQGHFTMTNTRQEIEEEWITQTDSLRAFVMKHVSPDPHCLVAKSDFYAAYQSFCDEHEITPVEKGVVGRRLPAIFPKMGQFRPKVGEKQARVWKGIRLSPPYDNMNVVDAQDKTHIQEKLTILATISEKKLNNSSKHLDIRHNSTLSDLKSRLFDVFGVLPFKPSQLPVHFQGDDLVRVNNLLTGEMLERGEVMKVEVGEGRYAWQLVRKG